MKASQDAPGQCTNCGVITGVRTDGLCNDCFNAQNAMMKHIYFILDPATREIVKIETHETEDFWELTVGLEFCRKTAPMNKFSEWVASYGERDWSYDVGVSPPMDSLAAEVERRRLIRKYLPRFTPNCPLLDQVELLYGPKNLGK